MQGYPMRSVAADEVAVTMAHSTGQGTSTPFSVSAFDASDTATPSFTSAAACALFAGVTRLSVPSSSSLPQRPQLESSVCHRSYSALVTRGRDNGAPGGPVCDMRTTLHAATNASTEAARASFRIASPSRAWAEYKPCPAGAGRDAARLFPGIACVDALATSSPARIGRFSRTVSTMVSTQASCRVYALAGWRLVVPAAAPRQR